LVYEQAVVQLPQWPASVAKFTSQPFEASPSQSPKPELQLMWQVLAVQLAVPFVALQAVVQLPQ
jgi:hypothetical protein